VAPRIDLFSVFLGLLLDSRYSFTLVGAERTTLPPAYKEFTHG